MSAAGFIAATRFGLGARPGELSEAARDPRGWLAQQLTAKPVLQSEFPSGASRMGDLLRARRQGDAAAQKAIQGTMRDAYLAEAGARTQLLIDSSTPLRERLVAFWSNHFTVSVQRPVVLGLAGAFEREAIRPHVAGKFRDMLGAVVRHPAMLTYLDQAQSIGHNSRAGRRREKGLNENLAREILELHTLGVAAGYTQTDVREFAKILTGWSLARVSETDAGAFTFQPAIHEPGEKFLLGKRYAEAGQAEAEIALTDLARHPATATHIARKFAQHFIADTPPQTVVDRFAKIFRDTDGDLGALARAAIAAPEAWSAPLTKVKTPNEFVVSALRATGFSGESDKLVAALRLLGQAPFAAPSPAGWPDTADQWIGPESVLRRAEWTMALGHRVAANRAPLGLLDATIGPVADGATRQAIERAPSTADAIALVFASPEFQRR